MTAYNILSLLAVPSVCAGFIGYVLAKLKKIKSDNDAVKLGVQAMLRSDMINMYNKYNDKGYAPIYVKDNFENVWTQYHALGANGVMDGIHEQFLALPTEQKG